MDRLDKDNNYLRSRRSKKTRDIKEKERDDVFKTQFSMIRSQIQHSTSGSIKENSVLSIISLINQQNTNKSSNLNFFTSRQSLPSFLLPSIPIIEPNKGYLTLKIMKSTVKSKSIFNTKFIVTSQGILSSQKKNDGCVSIGRQQINDFGERINDIYLFPTDACISRSHCKLLYYDYFLQSEKVKKDVLTIFMINHDRLNKTARIKNFPHDLLYAICKFVLPKKRIYLQDLDTIYGTYVRIRIFNPFSLFKMIFPCMTKYYNASFSNKKLASFMVNTDISLVNRLDVFENSKVVYKLFEKKTLIIKDEMNFLFDSKSGFVINSSGSIRKVMFAISQHLELFGSDSNDFIEIKSNERVFNSQSFDISSKIYNLVLMKNQILNFNFAEIEKLEKYSFLYLVLTVGDPCGIMNRGNEYLFLAKRNESNIFNFNLKIKDSSNQLVEGYLFSKDYDAAINLQTDSEFIIYYNSFIDRWSITDLSSFSNVDYFGLWIGTSPDKKKNVRFHQTSKFIVKNGDFIKISETIIKLKVNQKLNDNMDIF